MDYQELTQVMNYTMIIGAGATTVSLQKRFMQ